MRLLLDTNVYISYLLAPTADRIPNRILEAAFAGHITLLLSHRLTNELTRRVKTKPYLSERIDPVDLDDLLAALQVVRESIPDVPDEIPEVGDDRNDDFLFAHAAIARPDLLVSGERGVQKVGEIDGIRIVSPADCVRILEDRGIIRRNRQERPPE